MHVGGAKKGFAAIKVHLSGYFIFAKFTRHCFEGLEHLGPQFLLYRFCKYPGAFLQRLRRDKIKTGTCYSARDLWGN